MKHIGLSKSLILMSITLMMVFTFAFGFINPSIASAASATTRAHTNAVEEEDDGREYSGLAEAFHVGVNRSSSLQTNQIIFSDTIMSIAKICFAFVVFVMIILIGVNAILNCYDGKSRAEIIEKFKHILYGVLLFSIATAIVAMATTFQDRLINDLYNVEYAEIESPEDIEDTMEVNWLSNLLEMGLKIVGRLLEYILEFLFNLVSGNIGGTDSIDQYTLNNVLFLSQFGDEIDLNAVSATGMQLSTAPFTVAQWDRYTKAYFLLATIAVPIMLIALIKAAYDMVVNAGNFEKAMEVKKTSMRMAAGIIIVVLGPYLFRLILTFFNMLVFLIPVEFTFDIVVEDIDDANGLLSVFTSLWWLWIKFRIMLLFVVRQIMLTVMYIVTPVVIGFWTLSEKTKVFNKWIGETITNAATQFCYAMVFFIATIVLSGAQTNAFFTLLWMSMMLKLADFFKESFQNLFDKWSGINELQVADSMASKIPAYTIAAGTSSTKLVDANGTTRYTQFWDTVTGVHKFITKGDITEITSRSARLKAKNKDDLSSNAEDISSIGNILTNSYKGYNEEWSKYLQDAFTYNETTSGYSQYDDALRSIKAFDGSGCTNDRMERIQRKEYYRTQVQGLFKDVNWTNNQKSLEDLANRASSLQIMSKVQEDNPDYYSLALRQHDLTKERAELINNKAAIKYTRDQEAIPSLQAIGKQSAKNTIKEYTEAYLAMPEHQAEAPHVPQQVTLDRDSNLITIGLSKGSSQLSLSSDYIKDRLKQQGIAQAQMTAEAYERERNEIEKRLADSIKSANEAILAQSNTKASVPEAVKESLSQEVVSSSQTALDCVLEAYEKSGQLLDAKMEKQLEDYANALGYNAQRDLKRKYQEAINQLKHNQGN